MVLRLVQRPPDAVQAALPVSNGHLQIIEGIEVMVQGSVPTNVSVATWEQQGVLYQLSVEQRTDRPLSLGEATQLVTALIREQPR
jgi:hypothetical protein